jgi:general secretion pathway protein G
MERPRSFKLTEQGFTLIELLIVIVILGILASIAIPNLSGITEKAREEALTFNVRTLQTEISVYKFKHDNYPAAADTAAFINNYQAEFNALKSIVGEIGTANLATDYYYASNGSDYVFSVKLTDDLFIGISNQSGLETDLTGHLSLD